MCATDTPGLSRYTRDSTRSLFPGESRRSPSFLERSSSRGELALARLLLSKELRSADDTDLVDGTFRIMHYPHTLSASVPSQVEARARRPKYFRSSAQVSLVLFSLSLSLGHKRLRIPPGFRNNTSNPRDAILPKEGDSSLPPPPLPVVKWTESCVKTTRSAFFLFLAPRTGDESFASRVCNATRARARALSWPSSRAWRDVRQCVLDFRSISIRARILARY